MNLQDGAFIIGISPDVRGKVILEMTNSDEISCRIWIERKEATEIVAHLVKIFNLRSV